MERKLYEVQWNMRSGYWPEPLTAGELVQMDPETAATLNRCSAGVLVEWTPPVAPPPEPAPATAPEKPAETRGHDDGSELPEHVKRGPGRPPKAKAPDSPWRNR